MDNNKKLIGDITIQEVIKILPMEQAKRESLLEEFKNGSNADNYDVSLVLWRAFHDLYEQLTELKFQQLQYETASGKKPMSSNLYNDAKRLVWEDFQNILSGKKAEIDQMEEIRAKIRATIGETGNQNPAPQASPS